MALTPAPRRPRRWSHRAFGVVVRVFLVLGLMAMVAWPEWHEFGTEFFEPLFGGHSSSVDGYWAYGTRGKDVRYVRVGCVPTDDGRLRLLLRDSSLGVIAGR